MQTTYRLKSNELDESVLRSIQEIFRDKEIELTVCDGRSQKPKAKRGKTFTGGGFWDRLYIISCKYHY